MAGILDYFQNTMQSPLFLSGASLLTGGGMGGAIKGMQAGLQFQDHARRRATEDEQNKAYQGLLADPNIPQQILPVLRASQPSEGVKLAADYLSQNHGLEAEYKRAQIAKLKREAATGGEMPSNVREWQYYNALPPEKQQQYLNMKRAEKYLDLGTSFVRPNQSDPSAPPMATYQKDVAGQAAQKEMGEAQGKAVMDLPRQADNATLALDTINAIRNHPGKKWGLGVSGVLPGIPGTEQRGFVNLVDQAKGQVFLQAFNSLRGGGQITEAEGNKATQALARLDRAQRPQDFDAALNDLETVVRTGLSRAQRAAGPQGRVMPAPSTQEMQPARPRAHNPQTGQIVEWDGTQWNEVK